MPVFRLFGVFFRVAVDPPVVPPPPPGMGFRLQVFWGDSATPPHLSTLITTKITFPCNLLEITGADFLYMEIARLYTPVHIGAESNVNVSNATRPPTFSFQALLIGSRPSLP